MKNQLNTKTLVFTALLIALSYLGSLVKIFGSVALDALPAYFGALMLGGPIGALIGAVGTFSHLPCPASLWACQCIFW